MRIIDEVEAVASEISATPVQIALAWLLAQGDDIAPIPGTKGVVRVEENTAAENVKLSADQIERLIISRPLPASVTTRMGWRPLIVNRDQQPSHSSSNRA